jgi:HTH-type transcriptional regulator, sugar sensing transcriptional regulator
MSEIPANLPLDLIEYLKTMGLAEYEAKVYSALVLFKQTDAKTIYEYLNAPKPSVYYSLKNLMDKGLVTKVNTKPAVYTAIPPKIAIKYLTEIHENAGQSALKKLELLEKVNSETDNSEFVWALFGKKNVEHNMEKLISNAQKSIKLLLPVEYLDFLSFVKNKDIPIELLMFKKDSSIARQYNLKNLTVHDGYGLDISELGDLSRYFDSISIPLEFYPKFIFIFIDNEEFMYVPFYPEKARSGVSLKNPYTISFIDMLCRIIWEHTPEIPME